MIYKFSSLLTVSGTQKTIVSRSGAIGLAVLLSLFSLAPARAFHTFHTSLTRIDYNQQEKLLEVTIQLFTHDLQPVLEKRTKRRLDLGKTPDIDKLIFEYVKEHFVLQDASGAVKNLVWVGKEFENDSAYIYLEVPFDDNAEGAKLQNTIFFESFADQTNLVVARFGQKKYDLIFKAGDKIKEF